MTTPPTPHPEQALASLEQIASEIERDHFGWANGIRDALAALRPQAAPALNLSCKSVQKRLAAQWGFVPDAPAEQPEAKCLMCGGSGWLGGPTFYSPDEGGEPCPDCESQPEAAELQCPRQCESAASPAGHAIEEAESTHRSLDAAGVPRTDEAGEAYSLWGRVCCFAQASAPEAAEPVPYTDLMSDSVTVNPAAEPVAAPVQPVAERAGIELAARWVQQRLDDFISEHGITDPDTGALEFGRGARAQAQEEYVDELLCIVAGIRALATPPVSVDAAGWLTGQDRADLERIEELFSDGEGWDLPKARMQRLAELGVIRRTGGNYYAITSFGMHCLGREDFSFPLRTFAEVVEAAEANRHAALGFEPASPTTKAGEGE